jgi:hypothetical protein
VCAEATTYTERTTNDRRVHLDGVEEKKREKQQKKRNSRSGVQDDEEAMKCAGSQCRRRAGIKKNDNGGVRIFSPAAGQPS